MSQGPGGRAIASAAGNPETRPSSKASAKVRRTFLVMGATPVSRLSGLFSQAAVFIARLLVVRRRNVAVLDQPLAIDLHQVIHPVAGCRDARRIRRSGGTGTEHRLVVVVVARSGWAGELQVLV